MLEVYISLYLHASQATLATALQMYILAERSRSSSILEDGEVERHSHSPAGGTSRLGKALAAAAAGLWGAKIA